MRPTGRRGAWPAAGRRRRRASGASTPDAFGLHARPPTRGASTCATGCRASSRRSAAIARRWAPAIRSRDIDEDARAALARHRALPPRRHGPGGAACSSSCEHPMQHRTRSTSCAARTAAAGSSSSRRCSIERTATEIHDGILGCHCCIFRGRRRHPGSAPAAGVDGRARAHRSRTSAGLALRAMVGPRRSTPTAARFEAAAASSRSTYRDIVDALGPTFEGGYFLYRFSDPTFIVAEAVVRAVAGTVLARQAARHRHLRRLGPSDALAAGSVVAAAGARRPVFREALAGAAVHGARLRAGVLRRQRAAARSRAARSATRCARTRSSTSGPSASSSARCSRLVDAPRTTGRRRDQPHAQPAARGARRTASRCRRPAIATCSRRIDAAHLRRSGPVRGRGRRRTARSVAATIRRQTLDARSGADARRARAHPGVFRRMRSRTPAAPRGEFRSNPLYAVEADGDRACVCACGSRRRLRGRVRRLPPVPARRSDRSTRRRSTRCRPAGRCRRR